MLSLLAYPLPHQSNVRTEMSFVMYSFLRPLFTVRALKHRLFQAYSYLGLPVPTSRPYVLVTADRRHCSGFFSHSHK
jgi:hypothetical protein